MNSGNGSRWEMLKTIGTWLMWLTTVVVLLLRSGTFGGEIATRVEAQESRIARLEQAMEAVATKDDIADVKRTLERVEARIDRITR